MSAPPTSPAAALPVTVARLGAADAVRLRTIVASLPPPEWRGETVPSAAWLAGALADPRVLVVAAFGASVEGGISAGFASAYRFPALTAEVDHAYIYDVWVDPALRGRGVGRQLMDALTAACRSEGIAEAWIGTEGDNIAAQRLYRAAGGREAGRNYVEYEFDFQGGTEPPDGTEPGR